GGVDGPRQDRVSGAVECIAERPGRIAVLCDQDALIVAGRHRREVNGSAAVDGEAGVRPGEIEAHPVALDGRLAGNRQRTVLDDVKPRLEGHIALETQPLTVDAR